jgi:hypothetical protein
VRALWPLRLSGSPSSPWQGRGLGQDQWPSARTKLDSQVLKEPKFLFCPVSLFRQPRLLGILTCSRIQPSSGHRGVCPTQLQGTGQRLGVLLRKTGSPSFLPASLNQPWAATGRQKL